MNRPISEAEAVRRYPELHELVTAGRAGWTFRSLHDAGGELVGIAASYSRRQYTDALFIGDRTNVSAARVFHEGGGCAWVKEGSDLHDVVQELHGLPEPGEPGTPTPVKRSSLLWTR
ncbi:hypothetical protein ALI22I_02275 [Saccharothrix sp. ALI-22-I]|uniref:hypothetical protein n=1 Tax=Saccharothrix sp. ALI-22-I TaxID=1933778 RepID=UPI00097C6C77|nr:hypothetical protein [Saccharothrix sp. ALI-22-I]ONI92731.1 hypothetical protein ALI22I_02275 [Saccharothrix sp. ALI-22-I]